GKCFGPRFPFGVTFKPAGVFLKGSTATSGIDNDGIERAIFFLPIFKSYNVTAGELSGLFDVADVSVQGTATVLIFWCGHIAARFTQHTRGGFVNVALHDLHHTTSHHSHASLFLTLCFPLYRKLEAFADGR